ncbi:unnamed protein product, partial [Dicrocoelium dendriticum]
FTFKPLKSTPKFSTSNNASSGLHRPLFSTCSDANSKLDSNVKSPSPDLSNSVGSSDEASNNNETLRNTSTDIEEHISPPWFDEAEHSSLIKDASNEFNSTELHATISSTPLSPNSSFKILTKPTPPPSKTSRLSIAPSSGSLLSPSVSDSFDGNESSTREAHLTTMLPPESTDHVSITKRLFNLVNEVCDIVESLPMNKLLACFGDRLTTITQLLHERSLPSVKATTFNELKSSDMKQSVLTSSSQNEQRLNQSSFSTPSNVSVRSVFTPVQQKAPLAYRFQSFPNTFPAFRPVMVFSSPRAPGLYRTVKLAPIARMIKHDTHICYLQNNQLDTIEKQFHYSADLLSINLMLSCGLMSTILGLVNICSNQPELIVTLF